MPFKVIRPVKAAFFCPFFHEEGRAGGETGTSGRRTRTIKAEKSGRTSRLFQKRNLLDEKGTFSSIDRLLGEVNGVQFDYLQHIRDGLDRGAVLDELMRAYGTDVWNYAFFLTRRRELADDISQDVFVKVYNRLYTFNGQSSVKTWLLSITRNTARDALRSVWLRRVTLVDYWQDQRAGPSAERDALSRQMTDEIWSVVLSLPAKLREVLLLHAQYGLKQEEIAELLGVSLGTVKSRLHRARAAVSRKLNRQPAAGEEEWV